MISFFCSRCGTKVSAELKYAGAAASCPSCDQDLVVPATPSDAIEEANPPVPVEEQSPDKISVDSRGSVDMNQEIAPKHSLGGRLKSVAKDGWSSIKSQSKQAALRAQIEKLKNVDLHFAHRSFGEKCFESGIFDDQLGEQFQAIRDLNAKIADKREAEEIVEGETKMHALKRMGKHVAQTSHAQALLLKRQRLFAKLGQSAFPLRAAA